MKENEKKITSKEFATFIREFFNGNYPHQRFGQAFINKFYPNVMNPEGFANDIFYGEDWTNVWNLIAERFVDFEVKDER